MSTGKPILLGMGEDPPSEARIGDAFTICGPPEMVVRRVGEGQSGTQVPLPTCSSAAIGDTSCAGVTKGRGASD